MAIKFRHTQSGLIKTCPEGFSWTYFFFGPLVGIIRGMWIPAIVSLMTMGLGNLYFMFVINRKYAESLLERGYAPAGDLDQQKLIDEGLLAPEKKAAA